MKRILSLMFCAVLMATAAFGQAKKPTIMVVPSEAWCNQNGYMMSYDDMGTTLKLPDYRAALQNDMDLKLAIAKINDLMTDRGFPLKDLEATLQSIQRQQAEENMMSSKSGASMQENPIDRLRRVAKADIIIELSWDVKYQGPKATLTYIMRGLDSYSNKQIAGSSGASTPTMSAQVVVLLEEAVLANIDEFNNKLMAHFEDMFANGREVALDLRVWDDAGIDFEEEYNGEELSLLIDDWMAENTIQGRFSKLDGTETRIAYEQVRIPLNKPNGTAMDTEAFARQLSKYLKTVTSLPVKVVPRGLGSCMLIIGGK
ncbi:MAG: hypothetical protein IJU35_06065 [Paludibacteraceae bacterium]|nr:hypothetical protein [Paludibacteraceae bacterium]